MSRIVKRVLSVVTCVLVAVSAAACGPSGGGIGGSANEKVDVNKAQLYVMNYNGGMGSAWLESAVERFETEYAEHSFTEGTKGVQIWIDNQKAGGNGLIAQMPSTRNQVLFLENVNYLDYVYEGLMLDISDVVTENLSEKFGEDKTIESKLVQAQKDYYCINGKYYGLPHYQGFNGISYDVDLFDENRLFFDNTGKIGATSKSTNLSNGVDGKPGTYDDGLPATYDDFFALCDVIASKGMAPISWSGYYQFYFSSMMVALMADYAEEDNMMFFDFNGKTDKLIDSIAEDGTVTFRPETTITMDNGYELYNHASLYYPLTFCERVIKNQYYNANSFNTTTSHTDVQDDFLLSSYTNMKDIAMLVEGSWWQSEADGTFRSMEKNYVGAGKSDRRIGFMPLPKATAAEVGHKSYLIDNNYCVRFINATCKPEIIPLAKMFLQYCCTDKSLAEYNAITGATLGYKYSIEEEAYNDLTYFAKSIYDMSQASEIVYPFVATDFFYKNKTALTNCFRIAGKYDQPTKAMKDDNATAVSYFDLLKVKFNDPVWTSMRNS